MTVDTRSRLVSLNINILDSTGVVVSGPHDVSAALIDPGISIEFPEFEARSPNGWSPFRATIDLAVDVDGFTLNLDPRSTTGNPSGAALLAQGNRVDIRAAMEDRVTMGAICPPLYILKIRDAVNLPRRIIRLSLGDATLLEGRTGEGDRSGFERGTETNRHTIINNYLAGSDVAATADTLTRYPVAAPPQKTSANNWTREAGAIAGSAGAYLWLDNTGATRLTDIDFKQPTPLLSLTIGPGGDDVGTVGWSREANDVRPPEKLTCYATGSTPVEIENPRPIDETIPGDGFTAKTVTGSEEWTFGISPTYVLDTTTQEAEKLILPEIRTLSSGIVTGLTPNASTALRTSGTFKQTVEYSSIYGHELRDVTVEQVVRAQAGGNAYEPSQGDTTSDALTLLRTATTITYTYNRITGYMESRRTSVDRAWCLLEWTGDRPTNYGNNRFLIQESFRNTETWEKVQGNVFGGGADDLPQRWRYRSIVLQPRGVVEPNYAGLNADALVDDHTLSFDKTGTGREFEPPRPNYQQQRYSLNRKQYQGSATFTPAAGQAYKNKLDTISLRGADITSNGHCAFLAEMLGLFRYGRAEGDRFVGKIPDWLFTGYRPGARVDVTVDGQVLAYLLDGWTLTIDQGSAVWGASLVFVGVVGVTPDVVTPPVTVAINLSNTELLPDIEDNPAAAVVSVPVSNDELLPALDDNPVVTEIIEVSNSESLPALQDNPTANEVGAAVPVSNDELLPALQDNPVAAEIVPLSNDESLPALQDNPVATEGTSTVLHLEFEGTNGATTFTDSSSFNRTTSAVGAGTTITTAQFAVGSSSGDFDGVNSAIEYADTTDFTASGDWSISCHVRPTDFSATDGGANRCVWSLGDLSAIRPGLLWGTGGQLLFFAGSTRITSSALSLNTWAFVELIRSGGTYELFVDSVSQGTWVDSSTVDPSIVRIGASVATPTGNHQGQIDEFIFTVN